MIKLLKSRQLHFEPAVFTETADELRNPARGWFQVYGFDLTVEPDLEAIKWCLKPEETIALVLIDIGAYRGEKLPDEALGRLTRILEFYRSYDKEVILRVVYDREGKGLEREPSSISVIQTHMRQLGPVFQMNRDIIYTLQGLFVGSWGEMHTSRYLTPPQLKLLAQTLWDAVEGTCFLAVRKPVQWRQILESVDLDAGMRIGIYNDGMFGSDSDLGTYGEGEGTDWTLPWNRRKELQFLDKIGGAAPVGGEAVANQQGAEESLEKITQELRSAHISYLNGVYDPVRLEQWRKQRWEGSAGDCYTGISGYQYISCHLGYRFVVRSAQLSGRRSRELLITVENVGFAAIYESARPLLLMVGKDGSRQSIDFGSDANTWESGARVTLSVPVEDTMDGECHLFLGLKRASDGKNLLFANETDHTPYVFLGKLYR